MKTLIRFSLILPYLFLIAVACGPSSTSPLPPLVGDTSTAILQEGVPPIRHRSVSTLPTDTRTPDQIVQAACHGTAQWRCPAVKSTLLGAGSPVIPTSWTVPAWFIDPANSSGVASDSNPCTTTGAPCLTYQEIAVHRWGCIGTPNECPRFRQTTVITFMSSHTTNADPVYFRPAVENQAYVYIRGSLGSGQQVATGVLGTVTAKNRATPQLLTAVLPAGSYAAGELIFNTTHSSEARLYSLVSGTTWKISQPLVPVDITNPYFNSPFTPVEVNNWTVGDTVTIYNPVAVNIPDFSPMMVDYNQSGFNNQSALYALTIFDPGGANGDFVSIYGIPAILLADISSQRVLNARMSGVNLANFVSNCDFPAGVQVVGGTNQTLPTFSIYGGQFRTGSSLNGSTLGLYADTIIGATSNIGFSAYDIAYIETAVTLNLQYGGISFINAGTDILWGPGTINVQGAARLTYQTNALTSLLVGTLKINNLTTANSTNTTSNVVVPCGGITLNSTNLDAATSATCATSKFGGLAFEYGGGSIVLGSP